MKTCDTMSEFKLKYAELYNVKVIEYVQENLFGNHGG